MHEEHDVLMDGACREDRAGWHHLHIAGGPRQRGYQHGYLLAPEIAEGLRVNRYLATWDTGDDWGFFVEGADKLFLVAPGLHEGPTWPTVDAVHRRRDGGLIGEMAQVTVEPSTADVVDRPGEAPGPRGPRALERACFDAIDVS